MTRLQYCLAVDVGTSRIAAATARVAADGSIVTAPFALGRKSDSVATVVFVADDGDLSFGDVAERRGVAQPERLIREFKRNVGDDVALAVGGRSLPADQLYAQTVADIIAQVTEREGLGPEAVSLTHPTAWGGHRIEVIRAALTRVGVTDIELITEPEAAARHYEASRSFESGQTLAVYDLGGGTFDCVVLRKEADGSFGLIGDPVGIDDLGGADFDDAVMRHVVGAADVDVTTLDLDEPATRQALAQLRRECVDAKEALSFDSEVTIPALIPPIHTSVRLTRSEFEDMIAESIEKTADALADAVEAAGLDPEQLESILLIGGSSRIPRVAQRLSERFDRPIAIDADPKAAIALGAARTALIRRHDAELGAVPGSELALLGTAAGGLALIESSASDLALMPAPSPEPTKKRKSSPFVLGGAAVVIAGAIVFASTLSAGSGEVPQTTLSSTPTPHATPKTTPKPLTLAPAATVDPAEIAAPKSGTSAPQRSSAVDPNPRRTAAQAASPKAPTAKPTAPPASSASSQTPQSGPSAPPANPPAGTPSPEPTTPAPDPTTPAPEPTTPAPEPTTPAPDPTTPAPEPTTPTPDPTTAPAPDPTTPVPELDPTTPAPEPEPEPTTPPVEEAPAPVVPSPEPTAPVVPSPEPTDPV
jgi:actin-like ATPase involved in cell morphogenesis